MSGLFDRIARRRSDAPGDQTEPAPPSGGQPPVAGPAEPGPADAAGDQPTRFIGLPADAVEPPAGEPAAVEPPAGESPASEPAAVEPPPAGEQPTALFPLVPDQPTEAHPTLPEQPPAGIEPAALSAAATGAEIVHAGAAPPATGEPPAQPEGDQPQPEATAPQPERRPGFRERGRMRRRLRYLRRLRELQVRDLGGLAFDLRRFERKRDDLVAQKVDQIRACDDELRALETALDERRDIRDVRMPGIGGTCPRCFSIYGSNDRFCSHCGAALGGLAQGPAQVAVPPPPPPALPPAGSSAPTSPPPPQ